MSIIAKGASAIPTEDWKVTDLDNLKEGSVIFKFNGPSIGLRFLPEGALIKLIEGWIAARNQVSSTPLLILGIRVDTENGDIFVRGVIQRSNPTQLQAGINPYAITAIVAGMFSAAALIGFTFIYAYQPVEVTQTIARASWITLGVFVGIGVLTLIILRRGNAVG